VESIRAGMREVVENRALWRERGLQASRVVRERFSWDAVAGNVFRMMGGQGIV